MDGFSTDQYFTQKKATSKLIDAAYLFI